MADIPVEKRGGTPWWYWLVGLLVLAGVIWLVAELFDAEPDEDELGAAEDIEEPETAEPDTAAGDLIMDVALLLDAEDPQALAGRRVQLSDLRVTSVVGDSTFYVSPQDAEEERRFLVALDEQIPAPPEDVEGRYDVTEGQIVSLSGTVHELTRREPETWGITGAEAEQMLDDEIYLRAQQLDITQEAN